MTFYGVLQGLEGSPLGHWMRETGTWTYAFVNLGHILGVALLFGAIALLDLRLLGLWRSVPLALISRPAVTVAGAGVMLAIATGIPMFATKATDYFDNKPLFIKFGFILLALVNVALLHCSSAWRAHRTRDLTAAQQHRLALMGAASLLLWLGAITGGRMAGYW